MPIEIGQKPLTRERLLVFPTISGFYTNCFPVSMKLQPSLQKHSCLKCPVPCSLICNIQIKKTTNQPNKHHSTPPALDETECLYNTTSSVADVKDKSWFP